MLKKNTKFSTLIISFIISTSISVLTYLGFVSTGGIEGTSLANRIFMLLGGNFSSGGYIQFLTFLAFFWSLFEILMKLKNIKKQKHSFREKILPTNEKHLLLAGDVMNIQVRVLELEKKRKKSLLTNIIKKACMKFRSTKSISEMIEIISIQTDIDKEKSESDQSNIRYLTWVIPSIGFIGTVLGISQALQVAGSGDMDLITSTLGVAFDTTLIALILSIVVMWFFHELQEETDKLHAGIKEYVIENLVNKVEL